MVEPYLWWAIAGIALIIVELLSGTFYLLVIGLAAFAGAAASYYGHSLWIQAVLAAAVATVGVVLVSRYRTSRTGAPAAALDVGQSAVFESWASETNRAARVRYRNAVWDAQVIDGTPLASGQTLYICRVDGNTLHVSTQRPA